MEKNNSSILYTNSTSYLPNSTVHYYFLLSMIVINAVIAFAATSLNLLVILTFIKTATLRETPSNILLLGLAISDFCVAAIAQPIFIKNEYDDLVSYEDLDEITEQEGYFKIFDVIRDMLMVVSFLNIIAITVDRFLAVNLHLRYQELVTTKRCGITLVLIWILGSGLITVGGMHESKEVNISLLTLYFALGSMNVFFLIKISRVIRRHSVQIQVQQQAIQQSIDMPRYKKSVNTVYYVIVIVKWLQV